MRFKRVRRNLRCVMLDSTGRQIARLKVDASAKTFPYGESEAYLISPEHFMVVGRKTYAFYHVGQAQPVDWRTNKIPIPPSFIFEVGHNNYIRQAMDKAGPQKRQEVMLWMMIGILVMGLATVAYLTSQPNADLICIRSMGAHAWGYENATIPVKC